jgi:hypothetical protein
MAALAWRIGQRRSATRAPASSVAGQRWRQSATLLSSRLCHCNGPNAINSLFDGMPSSPELCLEERLGIVSELRQMWRITQEHPPPNEENLLLFLSDYHVWNFANKTF